MIAGKAGKSVLQSRVGRRITILFVVCALIPLAAFASVVLVLVSKQLHAEADRNLRQAAKASCMTLVEQLIALDTDLRLVIAELRHFSDPAGARMPGPLQERLEQRFTAVHLLLDDIPQRITGAEGCRWEVAAADVEHLAQGRALIHTSVAPDQATASIMIARAITPADPNAGLVIGTIATHRLWQAEGVQPVTGEFLILDEAGATLFASSLAAAAASDSLRDSADRTALGTYTWSAGDTEYIAGYRRLFMSPRFGTNWIVVLSRRQDEVLGPLTVFERLYLLATVLAFLIVAAMSIALIRRTLTPILKLQQAVRRVARGNFSTPVEIRSKDEFEDLGTSFNSMMEDLVENIRRREQTEQELVEARDAALSAARREADFLCSVSHELRTPLTSIVSFTEILANFEDDSPETRQEFIEIVGLESKRLMKMIDEILQFRDLREGFEERGTTVDLRLNLETAIDDLPRPAQARVKAKLPADLPTVHGDPDLLRQAWVHLLVNATQYSEPDTEVTVAAAVRGGSVVVEVTDHGIGIPPEHRDEVFERFFQLSSDILTSKNSGTGLGLALVREIVRRHRGTVEVDSEVGVGSTFRVTLPLQEDSDAATAVTTGAELA